MGLGMVNVDLGGILNGLGNVGRLFKDIRAAITGREILDSNRQAELEVKLAEIEFTLQNSQTEINKIEAGHTSLFVAGWRPAVGWTCAAAFAWTYIVGPLFSWITMLLDKPTPMPVIEPMIMMQVLLAMLGLGGLRTYEKLRGAEGNR